MVFCIVVLAISLALFVEIDCRGYEYGLSSCLCSRRLPYNLTPSLDPHSSFFLKNDDDYEVAGIGFRFETTDFVVKNIISYGYNDSTIVLVTTDSLNSVRVLAAYETGYTTHRGYPEISFKELLGYDEFDTASQLQWVNVDRDMWYHIYRVKFVLLLGMVLLLVLTAYLFWKWRCNYRRC